MVAPLALLVAGAFVIFVLVRVTRPGRPAPEPAPFWRCPRCGETDDFEDADFGQAFRCRVCGFLDYDDESLLEL